MRRKADRSFAGGAALAAGVALFALVSLASRPAEAYPQFQLSAGTQTCAQCHYSPAGSGLLTSWGRGESADTISRGGDGAFLHGLWAPPAWLALGGDVRGAVIRNEDGGNSPPEVAVFPMQADLYARLAFGNSISVYLEGGARGTTRPQNTGLAANIESVISREHYVMWKPSATGAYVRAGRFFAPFGLRLVEHIFFVRQFTGFNLYEETYNLSGGYLAEDWELHVTAFTPPPSSLPDALQSVGMRGSGGAAYAERRLAAAAVGAQARVSVNSEQTLIQGGATGKAWVDQAKLLFMGEVDLQRRSFKTTGFGENQLVAFLNLTAFPVKGLMAGFSLERYQEDLALASSTHNAVDLEVNLFPWAHCEVILLGRYQWIGSGNADGDPGSLAMLQLHYYL